MYPDPDEPVQSYGTEPKLELLESAINAKCDGLDGLDDGVISEPQDAPFDPVVDLPMCPQGMDSAECFTVSMAAIERVYDGLSNSAASCFQVCHRQ